MLTFIKSSLLILIPLLLNGCAIYGPQFGIGDYAQFCSNLEKEKGYKSEKFYISDREYFYVSSDGKFYSENELSQIRKLSTIDPSAKKLVDESKKIYTVKMTRVSNNKNICSSTLVGSEIYPGMVRSYIPGKRVLVSSDGNGINGVELYNNVTKNSLDIQFIN